MFLLFNFITNLISDIKEYVRQIEKSVSSKEPRYMSRVMRSLVNVRRRLNQTILRKLFQGYLGTQAVQRDELIAFLDQVVNVLLLITIRMITFVLYTIFF